jgi:hypothetical protein
VKLLPANGGQQLAWYLWPSTTPLTEAQAQLEFLPYFVSASSIEIVRCTGARC